MQLDTPLVVPRPHRHAAPFAWTARAKSAPSATPGSIKSSLPSRSGPSACLARRPGGSQTGLREVARADGPRERRTDPVGVSARSVSYPRGSSEPPARRFPRSSIDKDGPRHRSAATVLSSSSLLGLGARGAGWSIPQGRARIGAAQTTPAFPAERRVSRLAAVTCRDRDDHRSVSRVDSLGPPRRARASSGATAPCALAETTPCARRRNNGA